jgi:PHP family Zn ribbon phosphoesterase
MTCEYCAGIKDKFVPGVLDRVISIGDFPEPRHPETRPPYFYQIPLEFVPGLNKRMLQFLIEHFGSEMAVLHTATRKDLQKVVGVQVASDIICAREGKMSLASGGGGRYGKVKGVKPKSEQLTFGF